MLPPSTNSAIEQLVQLLPANSNYLQVLGGKVGSPMSPPNNTSQSKALEGVHGVHMLHHSPFSFEEITQYGDFDQSTCRHSSGANHRLIITRVWQQRPSCMRPIQCSLHGDQSVAETIANVLTSLPFIGLGLQAPRKNLSCKLYANSLIGVGVASSLYHSSRGKLRKYLRWVDYTMIATTTVVSFNHFGTKMPSVRIWILLY